MKADGSLAEAVSRFGAALKAKLSGKGAAGAPEDQVRAPLETLLADLAGMLHFKPGDVVAVGEATLSELKTRPDYAVKVRDALVGFIEVKAPGKGADPRRFKGEHDRAQWERLKSLPNLVYTDGNAFSLWRDGRLAGEIVRLEGDVESAGAKLAAPPGLERLFADFLRWDPVPPTSARALAEVSARLCRLLRDEVAEQLALGTQALTGLAEDWRKLLFPEATDEEFADGYAQAVTFGLLTARAQGIPLDKGLDPVAKALSRTNSVIGGAFKVLTDDAEGQDALATSLGTLVRVLGAVDWAAIGKGDPEAWLYFYEHFLEAYDNDLRKQTGSYYTPPEVVTARPKERVTAMPFLCGATSSSARQDRPPSSSTVRSSVTVPSARACFGDRPRKPAAVAMPSAASSAAVAGPMPHSLPDSPCARVAADDALRAKVGL